MQVTMPGPFEEVTTALWGLLTWAPEKAWVAYKRNRDANRDLMAEAVRRARKARERAERKLESAERAAMKVVAKEHSERPQQTIVQATAAQLVMAQKAMEQLRESRRRQKRTVPPKREQRRPQRVMNS